MKKKGLRQIANLPLSKKVAFAVACFGVSFFLALLVAEIALHYHNSRRTLAANETLLDYDDTWRQGGMGPGGYLKENFHGKVLNGYGGEVEWINNSQGFRSQRDFTKVPERGVLRILSLGDSFTAGYRVAQGRTYSDLLQKWISDQKMPCEVLISCIESPQQGLTYLRTEGHKWRPHIVLLGVTLGNDITQDYIYLHPEEIGFRHGLEQYDLPDSCLDANSLAISVKSRSPVKFLRQHSHLFNALFPQSYPIISWYGATSKPKVFDACQGLGFYIKDTPEVVQEAYQRHFRVLLEFKQFCESRNILFAVLVFPQRFQVQPKDWQSTVKFYSLRGDAFDLQLPNKRIRDFCERQRIALIDPIEFMRYIHKKREINMYLPLGDMHWNGDGHYYWFLGAKRHLAPLITAAVGTQRAIEEDTEPITQPDRL